MKTLFAVAALLTASGCATTFVGAPKVTDGPAGCERKCTAWGLEFVGMVAVGEYSDGCICRKKGSTASSADVTGVAAASIAGVGMQMEAERQRQSQSHPTYHR